MKTKPNPKETKMRVDVLRDNLIPLQENFIQIQKLYPNKEVISAMCITTGKILGWNLVEKR